MGAATARNGSSPASDEPPDSRRASNSRKRLTSCLINESRPVSKHPDLADSGVEVLLPHHRDMLTASAISPEIQKARGYTSAVARTELQRLGFNTAQSRCVPALILPTWRPCGERGLTQMRPDQPRSFPDGRLAKYEMPGQERMCLDVPPTVQKLIGDPKTPLFLTEGVKKGDALASVGVGVVSLLGVTCWKGTNEQGGKVALPDWHDVALNGRELQIVFDSDVMRKRTVYFALRSVKEFLEGRGADVWLLYLPSGEGGRKMGVDDYLAAGHTLDELLRLATKQLIAPPEEEGDEEACPYQETAQGLVWNKPTRDGFISTPLTNFTARIVADVVEDDGAERTRLLEIETHWRGRPHRFCIRSE